MYNLEKNGLIGRELVKYLFEVDNEDRFVRLIIPFEFIKGYSYGDFSFQGDLNLIGRKRTELSIDEVVAVKTYSAKLIEDNK